MPLLTRALSYCPTKMMDRINKQFKKEIKYVARSKTDAVLLFVDPTIKARISLYYEDGSRSDACVLWMQRKDKHLAGELTNLIVNGSFDSATVKGKVKGKECTSAKNLTVRKMTKEERVRYRC